MVSGSFGPKSLDDPKIDIHQAWLASYELEPYVLYKAIRRGYRVIEVPVTVRYHAKEGFTKMRGCAIGGACSDLPSSFGSG